jgi:hypothetical protein
MANSQVIRQLWIHCSQEQPGAPLKSTATVATQDHDRIIDTVSWAFKDSEQVKRLAELMENKDTDGLRKSMPVIFDLRGTTADTVYHHLFRMSSELYFNNQEYHSGSGDPHRRLEDDLVDAGKFLLKQWKSKASH